MDERNPDSAQGLRNSVGSLGIVFDEASAIPKAIWEGIPTLPNELLALLQATEEPRDRRIRYLYLPARIAAVVPETVHGLKVIATERMPASEVNS